MSAYNGDGLDDGTPLADRDGILALEDPWELLNACRAVDMADRAQYLQRFLDLVTLRPPGERDALLEQGREVWRYRMETARRELKRTEQTVQGVARTASVVATDDLLAELVYRETTDRSIGYLVHHFTRPDDPPEYTEALELAGATYYPPSSKLIESRAILLPAGVEDYGSSHQLFLDICAFLDRWVLVADGRWRELIGCYVLMTWLFDRFEALPYLRAQGDTGAGKSTLIEVVGAVCYRQVRAAGAITAAPIFRLVDMFQGCTLVLDEADFNRSDEHDDIIKVCNVGYQRGVPVLRCERNGNGSFDVIPYDVFGPKILSTRRRFNDAALESRCLSRTMPVQQLEDLGGRALVRGARFRREAAQLRNRLLWWRFQHYTRITEDAAEPVSRRIAYRPGGAPAPSGGLPGKIEPRIAQIVQPLLAAAVGDLPLQQTIREMIGDYSAAVQAERRDSMEGVVAGTLLREWVKRKRPDRLIQKIIGDAIREERGWQNLTDRKLGDVLHRILDVGRESRGGVTYVKLVPEKAEALCRRLGLALEDFERA